MNRRLAAATLCLCLLAACAAPAPPPWQSTELRDHPLAGRIWQVATGRFINRDDLARALVNADAVLLGETHDNPDHHRIQAWAVTRLFDAGRQPGLAIEMIREDQQTVLDAYRARRPADPAGLGAALGWDRSGWPAWRHYAPVIGPFFRRARPVRAANIARGLIRPLARRGYAALGAERVAALRLDRPIDPAITAAMAREMVEAHCGKITVAQAEPFTRIQITRDAVMAEALEKAADGSGAVLVAGTGHIRRDRGIPFHLKRRENPLSVLTLAPIEVRAGVKKPQDYAGLYGVTTLPFDYLWFTPRTDRKDPCDNLRI